MPLRFQVLQRDYFTCRSRGRRSLNHVREVVEERVRPGGP